jgi:glycosyltransferase involved in cell wall biosynthesis
LFFVLFTAIAPHMTIGPAQSRFVCVFNRKRDFYQVPLGLHEAGLLEALVTDFYAPDAARVWLPGFLMSRRTPGLPRGRTRAHWPSLILQYTAEALRLPMGRVFARVDRMLGNAAGRLARGRGQALYCYHQHIPEWIDPGTPLIVFVFHPLAEYESVIMAADGARFPEARAAAGRRCTELAKLNLRIDWNRADAVVCASGCTVRSVLADGCAPEKIAIIPYGLPDSELPVQVMPRESDAPAQFLFVGQGVQRKGLHHLIRAWQQWQAAAPSNAQLTIVSYLYEQDIIDLIEHPGITVLGYQSRDQLEALYARADVFVLPSMLEGFGLVYLEALAKGCHVIGTVETGLPDLGLDAEAVTLVEPGAVDDIASALANCAAKCAAGGYDRAAIIAQAAQWSEARFRKRIAEHARTVLRGISPGNRPTL